MALTGQLSDMSLAELIEFFSNQRKTGRLKVDYHHGHGVFFFKEGELVDARVGSLSGAEAIYLALTLPNAAFDFSADFEPPRRSIEQSWKHVVLEGLRRLDEGASPRQSDAFGPDWTPSESDLALLIDRIERLDAGDYEEVSKEARRAAAKAAPAGGDGDAPAAQGRRGSAAPLSMTVESAAGGGRRKLYVFGVAACVVLACAVAAVPVARRMGAKSQPPAQPAPARTEAPRPDAPAPQADAPAETQPAEAQPEAVTPQTVDPAVAAAFAARREREARERLQREREQRAEEARRSEQAGKTAEAAAEAEKPAAPVVAGPKVVRVSVSYDENGRVTQASVAGATPGAEVYGATALRVARSRRFPAGKAGGTVISIPVN